MGGGSSANKNLEKNFHLCPPPLEYAHGQDHEKQQSTARRDSTNSWLLVPSDLFVLQCTARVYNTVHIFVLFEAKHEDHKEISDNCDEDVSREKT